MISAANFFLSLIVVLCFGLGIGYLLGQKCQKDSKADILEDDCPECVEGQDRESYSDDRDRESYR